MTQLPASQPRLSYSSQPFRQTFLTHAQSQSLFYTSSKMTALRNTALLAIARPAWRTAARSSPKPLQHQYSTAKDVIKRSGSLPWYVPDPFNPPRLYEQISCLCHEKQYTDGLEQTLILASRALSAGILTASGTYVALQPRSPAHHDDHTSYSDSDDHESVSDKASNLKDAASDTKEDIKQKLGEEKAEHKEKVAGLSKSLIKGERSGESVKNHGIASEKNEHKIREGKFCDDEFDNHITKHSSDPGKDFEKIKKEKGKAEAK